MKKFLAVVVLLNIFVSVPVFAGDSKEQTRQKILVALDNLNKALESELKEQKKLAKKQEAEQKAFNKQMADFDKRSSVVIKDLQERLAELKKIIADSDEDLRLLAGGH